MEVVKLRLRIKVKEGFWCLGKVGRTGFERLLGIFYES